ncbi:MAG: DinB family protein [Vicinamibacterales bacterium]
MPVALPANQTQASLLLDDLGAIRQRADQLMARVSDDQTFSWQPHDGRAWSVGQCLDHLSQGNRAYLAGIRDALAHASRGPAAVTAPIRSTWCGRRFAASMVIRDAQTIDVNRPTFPNPFLPLVRLRVGTGFRILLAHMRRHIDQAQRVLDAHAQEHLKVNRRL